MCFFIVHPILRRSIQRNITEFTRRQFDTASRRSFFGFHIFSGLTQHTPIPPTRIGNIVLLGRIRLQKCKLHFLARQPHTNNPRPTSVDLGCDFCEFYAAKKRQPIRLSEGDHNLRGIIRDAAL